MKCCPTFVLLESCVWCCPSTPDHFEEKQLTTDENNMFLQIEDEEDDESWRIVIDVTMTALVSSRLVIR